MRSALLVAALAALAGCATTPEAPAPTMGGALPQAADAPAPAFRAVHPCPALEETEAVARDTAALDALWAACREVEGGRPPASSPARPPAVDFASEMVVAYAWGARPSSGYEVAPLRTVPGAEAFHVVVVRVVPGGDCLTLAVVTHPGFLAVVPRRDGDVEFGFLDAEHHCGP